MSGYDPPAGWRSNPFFVLGLPTDASYSQVERTGQKLLALLAVDATAAGRYETPLGSATRTIDDVRSALMVLRDPEQRVIHELMADIARAAQPDDQDREEPWKQIEHELVRSGRWHPR